MLFNLWADTVNQNNPHTHSMEHGDIFNQILKADFLDKFTRKGDHKGLLTEAMNVGRNIAQPPYEREVGGRFFGH